jgi:hypothetical protein
MVSEVAHTATYAEHIVVAQVAPYFSYDHRDGVRAEFYAHLRVEIIYCFYKPDATDLENIVGRAAPTEAPYYAEHEAQVSVYKLFARFFIARGTFLKQVFCFFCGKRFQLRCVYTADFDFIIIHIVPL